MVLNNVKVDVFLINCLLQKKEISINYKCFNVFLFTFAEFIDECKHLNRKYLHSVETK